MGYAEDANKCCPRIQSRREKLVVSSTTLKKLEETAGTEGFDVYSLRRVKAVANDAEPYGRVTSGGARR